MNICLLNEQGLSSSDFDLVTKAVQHFVPLVTAAWGLPPATVSTGIGKPNDWLIHLTDAKRGSGSAYHTIENGVPAAYCHVSGIKVPGHYNAPNAKRNEKELFTPGLIANACHEIAEMICDSAINRYSAPDAQGRPWLMEVCDHVFGTYMLYRIGTVNVVLPNITLLSFYDVNGKAPYDLTHAVAAPFKMTPRGYGYYKNSRGSLIKL